MSNTINPTGLFLATVLTADKRIVRLAERKRKAQDNLGALRAATAETIKYGDWR